jgi:predicted metalloprotease
VDIEGREESTNVEDRRGQGGGGRAGLAVGGAGGIILLILGLVFGVDVSQFFNNGPGNPGARQERRFDPEEEKTVHFVKVVFGDTERVWTKLFADMGKTYRKPTLVLFTGQVNTACGLAGSAVGPFYCPGDSKVYIDLSFYHDMERKLNAPGEFARAYVIAHEVGHHVQRLLGYSTDRRKPGETENEGSVRLELQADYLAGVWAHHGQDQFHFLQSGDIDSAINAAFQIGDDRLQKQARGYVVPEKFTHGTSAQRTKWFKRGFDTGDVRGARALFELPYNQL